MDACIDLLGSCWIDVGVLEPRSNRTDFCIESNRLTRLSQRRSSTTTATGVCVYADGTRYEAGSKHDKRHGAWRGVEGWLGLEVLVRSLDAM